MTDGGESWREHAVCQSIGTTMFYPELGENEIVAAAKRTCQTCPVIADCFAYIMRVEDARSSRHGVWANTVPHERTQAQAAGVVALDAETLRQPGVGRFRSLTVA